MPQSVFAPDTLAAIAEARRRARDGHPEAVIVDGTPRRVPYPSPDWREIPIYFLMLDRFANPDRPPAGAWNRRFDFRQGGSFKGVQAQLGYLAELGMGAIWLSPVLRNAAADRQYSYHGYGAQDFLRIDPRFASDGTEATAECELAELVAEAHARGTASSSTSCRTTPPASSTICAARPPSPASPTGGQGRPRSAPSPPSAG